MNTLSRVVPLVLVALTAVVGRPLSAAGVNQRALQILRTALDADARWIKVHAAEALLSADAPQGVARTFEIERASKGGEPEYRIGIWRVLAQAARRGPPRERWVKKIVEAFLDTSGPDRLHAAETLAKLGYRASGPVADAFDLEARTARGSLAVNARWVLANSGRPHGDLRLAELLDSDDVGTRADAAYAMRYLQKLSPAARAKLAAAALKEPRDAGGRMSLISAAFVQAPVDQKAYFRTELLKYAGTGTNAEQYEVCAALAKAGQDSDRPLLTRLLDSSDPDLRVAAAHALLTIR